MFGSIIVSLIDLSIAKTVLEVALRSAVCNAVRHFSTAVNDKSIVGLLLVGAGIVSPKVFICMLFLICLLNIKNFNYHNTNLVHKTNLIMTYAD